MVEMFLGTNWPERRGQLANLRNVNIDPHHVLDPPVSYLYCSFLVFDEVLVTALLVTLCYTLWRESPFQRCSKESHTKGQEFAANLEDKAMLEYQSGLNGGSQYVVEVDVEITLDSTDSH